MIYKRAIRVLLVESEAVLAEITSFRLELLGYNVTVAESAEEAMEHLGGAEELPDAIVLDLTLPGINGIDLTERLKSEPRTADIPVMALSHEADLDAVQNAFHAGAQDYLVTPYNPKTLEEKVQQLVQSGTEGSDN